MIDQREDYSRQLRLLQSMGFMDIEKNRSALGRTGGNLQLAVDLLTNTPREPRIIEKDIQPFMYAFPELNMEQQNKVLLLSDMGFKDEGKIRHALSKSKWDIETAANLLAEDVGLDSSFTGQLLNASTNVNHSSFPVQFSGDFAHKQEKLMDKDMFAPIRNDHQSTSRPITNQTYPTNIYKAENPFEDDPKKSIIAEFDPFADSNTQ